MTTTDGLKQFLTDLSITPPQHHHQHQEGGHEHEHGHGPNDTGGTTDELESMNSSLHTVLYWAIGLIVLLSIVVSIGLYANWFDNKQRSIRKSEETERKQKERQLQSEQEEEKKKAKGLGVVKSKKSKSKRRESILPPPPSPSSLSARSRPTITTTSSPESNTY